MLGIDALSSLPLSTQKATVSSIDGWLILPPPAPMRRMPVQPFLANAPSGDMPSLFSQTPPNPPKRIPATAQYVVPPIETVVTVTADQWQIAPPERPARRGGIAPQYSLPPGGDQPAVFSSILVQPARKAATVQQYVPPPVKTAEADQWQILQEVPARRKQYDAAGAANALLGDGASPSTIVPQEPPRAKRPHAYSATTDLPAAQHQHAAVLPADPAPRRRGAMENYVAMVAMPVAITSDVPWGFYVDPPRHRYASWPQEINDLVTTVVVAVGVAGRRYDIAGGDGTRQGIEGAGGFRRDLAGGYGTRIGLEGASGRRYSIKGGEPRTGTEGET